MNHMFIVSSITFGVISQTIIKWRMNVLGPMPEESVQRAVFLIKSLFDPFIMISIILTLGAGMTWMGAMSKFNMSYAYPFMSISYPMIIIIAWLLFGEQISYGQMAGTGFIIAGIYLCAR